MLAIDLHTHTRFFHGHRRLGDRFDPVGLRLLCAVADARGLDALATTNHDYYRAFDRSDLPVALIPGIEVSSTRGHVLVIGPNPPKETIPETLEPEHVVEIAHDRGCAAIIAHPYRGSTVREVEAPYDAIEVNGKHPRTREWATRLAHERDLPVTGGSDAHYPIEVGRAYTAVDVDSPTPRNVVEAIREGRITPRIDTRLTDRLLGRLYRQVHRGKDHLDRPDWATPGVGTPPGEE